MYLKGTCCKLDPEGVPIDASSSFHRESDRTPVQTELSTAVLLLPAVAQGTLDPAENI